MPRADSFWWEPFLTIGLLLALAVVARAAAPRCSASLIAVPRHLRWGVLAAALVAFGLRQFLVTPAFLHDFYVGPAIVSTALTFPPSPDGPMNYGVEYGLAGFTVLSLIASLFGRTAETVLTANNAFSALSAIPLAAIAAGWSGWPVAGLYAAAIWATSPLIARVAHSEDIQTIGMFWTLTGLAFLQSALSSRSRLLVIGAVISFELAALSRQTFHLWLGIAAVICVEYWLRSDREHRRRLRPVARWLVVAAACAAVPILLRMHFTANTWEFADVLTVIRVTAQHSDLFWWTLEDHPIFGVVSVSFTVPLLGIIGLVVFIRRSPWPLAILLAFGGWFAASFAVYPNLGSNWPFRFHFYTLAVLAAGAGAAWVMNALAPRRSQDARVQIAAAAVLALLGLLSAATINNLKPNAEFVEYRFMRDALEKMPKPYTIVGNGGTGIHSRIPDLLGYRAGVPVVIPNDPRFPLEGVPRPLIFLEGIACHSHDLTEFLSLSATPAGVRPDENIMARFHQLARDKSQHYGRDLGPAQMEMLAPCARIVAESTPLVEGPEVQLEDAPPWSFFDVNTLRPRLRIWEPPAAQ